MHIGKTFTFEAAHILPNHPGKCSKLHGHSYTVEVIIGGTVNDEPRADDRGFILDYATLKQHVQPIIDELDHDCLNFHIKYPSAENIATYIAHRIWNGQLAVQQLVVRVRETAGTFALWDSNNTYDRERFTDPLDADWRSPKIDAADNIPEHIQLAHGEYMLRLVQALYHGTRMRQLELYRDSMGQPGEIYNELKAAIGEKEAESENIEGAGV